MEIVTLTPAQVAQIVEDATARGVLEGLRRADAASPSADDRAIVPDRLYTPDEVARIFGFGTPDAPRTKSVYEIPEAELPKLRIGAARGAVRYLGADLLSYARGLPPRDTEADLDAARQRLTDRLARPGPVTGAVGTPGRRRIL